MFLELVCTRFDARLLAIYVNKDNTDGENEKGCKANDDGTVAPK